MIEKPPLPIWVAARAVAKCAANTAVRTARRRLHLSNDHVGEMLHFADGTTSWVYRETVVDGPSTADPAALVVGFRLRAVRGRGHALRWSAFLGPSTTSLFRGSTATSC